MTQLALLNSESLLGKEIKEALRTRPDLTTRVALLTTVEDEFGTVTDGVDGAAFVQELTDDSLSGCDVVVVCPGPSPAGTDWRPSGSTLVYVDPSSDITEGTSLVSGVNLEKAQAGRVLISPHPATIALSLLLGPLRQYGLERAACWAILPASVAGQQGAEELIEQARSLLSFQGDLPNAVFGRQVAFNVTESATDQRGVASEIASVLGEELPLSLQLLQAGIFHSVAVGLQVQLSRAPEPEDLVAELTASQLIERPDDPEDMGPIAAAGQSAILLGRVEKSPGIQGGISLWAVMDNLSVGGASNVLAVIEALAAPRH
jgi:aspartate-semialdehyde dehydrogenase